MNNDRSVLKPNELDIYLPEINLAIEYNGEYWHSISQSKVNRDDKSYRCLLKGITLIHIEEVDWKANKKYIMHNLKKFNTRIMSEGLTFWYGGALSNQKEEQACPYQHKLYHLKRKQINGKEQI